MDTLENRVKDFKVEFEPVLKKYNLKIVALVDFPLYKKIPLEVQLALLVLKKHEGEYKIGFQNAEEELKKEETKIGN